MKRAVFVCLLFALWMATGSAHPQDASKGQPAAAAPSASSKADSSGDIAAAKAAHKVWVNLDTGIYHKGGRWYGKTKNGKFISVDDAKKAGYKAAKRD